MKTIRYFFVSSFLLLFNVAIAQNVEFVKDNFPKEQKRELKEAIDNIEDGDEFYEMQRGMYFQKALEYYLKANKFNPNNATLNYKIGKCYITIAETAKAIKHLEKSLKLNPMVAEDINLMLAQAYQLDLQFDKAIEEYQKFRKAIDQQTAYEMDDKISKKIDECKNGKKLVQEPVRVFIDNIGKVVNSPYPDYGPIVNADESILYFTSRRPNTTGGKKDDYDFNYYEDIYISYNRLNSWTKPQNPGSPLNDKWHESVVGISPDGQKLLLYNGDKGGDIYVSRLEGKEWSKPLMLDEPVNTKDYHESSACFSPDERTLYFVSDRPGGLGEHDIYKSTLNRNGEWMKPINLGPTINTKFDEDGAFIHPDGKTLYFSSNGHNTMGGYDIFRSVLEDGTWSKPENLGYPINSPDNDIFFSTSASGEHGYYSTKKSGGYGQDDIYVITFLGPEKLIVMNSEHNLLASRTQAVSETVIESTVEIKSNPVTILKGKIHDEKTGDPVAASIELIDNEKNEVLAVFSSNSATGRYLVSLPAGKNYGIAIKAENYLFHSENFNIPKASIYNEIIKDIPLKKVEVGEKIVLNNIFFDSGKAKLRPESYAELGVLRKLMKDNPGLKIEISGHTDNVGSDNFNQQLSEKRAKSVVDYLISQGIDASRLKYTGYGESQPIADNSTKEGRQKNRRTEFEILEK